MEFFSEVFTYIFRLLRLKLGQQRQIQRTKTCSPCESRQSAIKITLQIHRFNKYNPLFIENLFLLRNQDLSLFFATRQHFTTIFPLSMATLYKKALISSFSHRMLEIKNSFFTNAHIYYYNIEISVIKNTLMKYILRSCA